MSLKKTLLSTLLIASLCVPVFAHAGDLIIVNNTDKDSTSVINKGYCSTTIMGKDGITKARTTKIVKDLQLRMACMKNLDNCKADVYMTNDCTGPIAATVTLSVKTGIKQVGIAKDVPYKVTWTAFSIRVEQLASKK
ncbi:MAG: hypothetical protein H0W64_02385 [Gammaproteobacteria bacterium]|nr:hypothetical protein [Gammaproteobacteria bacterium]